MYNSRSKIVLKLNAEPGLFKYAFFRPDYFSSIELYHYFYCSMASTFSPYTVLAHTQF